MPLPSAPNTLNKPKKHFITIQVDEEVKRDFEKTRIERGFKRASDYGRKIIKEDIRRYRA